MSTISITILCFKFLYGDGKFMLEVITENSIAEREMQFRKRFGIRNVIYHNETKRKYI